MIDTRFYKGLDWGHTLIPTAEPGQPVRLKSLGYELGPQRVAFGRGVRLECRDRLARRCTLEPTVIATGADQNVFVALLASVADRVG